MSTVVRSQLLNINSKHRITGDPWDFTVTINDCLLNADKNESIKIIVLDACVNRSWYTIDTSNNSFILTYVDSAGVTQISTITVNPGYYDVFQLKHQLDLLLVGWTIGYFTPTNTYQFTPPNTGLTYAFTFQNYFCEVLGFPLSATPQGSFSTPFTSSQPVRVNLENSLCIHCDVAKTMYSCIDNFSTSVFLESDIILKIPIQSGPFDNIVYQSQGNDNFSYVLSVKNIHTMRFWLTSENNRILQIPYDWTICFKLEYSTQTASSDDSSVPAMVKSIRDYVKLIVLSKHMD